MKIRPLIAQVIILERKLVEFELNEEGNMYFKGRLCVLDVDELKLDILKKLIAVLMLCTLVALKCIET